MNEVLLTVSGQIDPHVEDQVKCGDRPEPDYLRMARVFHADLVDYKAAKIKSGAIGKILEIIGGKNLSLAWTCYLLRHKYRVIFTDGEQVGIPLAFLLKYANHRSRPFHFMISHILSVGKKMILLDQLGLCSHIDIFFVYSSWQKSFIENRWKISSNRVVYTPFMVDTDFFSPEQAHSEIAMNLAWNGKPLICAVGLEFRDYPTLIEAVRGMDIQVVIAAASPWSKRRDSTQGQQIPENVTIQRFTQYELRDLYAASNFLVMPLYPVNFQAGVTAILEAMSMGKAVVCSRIPGQTDVVVDNETGVYISPGDSSILREVIKNLLNQPFTIEKMGYSGRERVLNVMSLDCYVNRLNNYVQAAIKV
jgi:glycosyltransferase involved in cell wall biosynthesis